MSKSITIAQSAVNAKLVNPSKEDKLVMQQLLSYKIDGADHMSLGEWDGRTSFFDFPAATFPAGFVIRAYRAFKAAGYTVNIARRPLPVPLGVAFPIVDTFPEDARYDYQRQVPDLVLRHGQIVAQVATGGGKCLGRDTPVLMFDGTIKPAQDVVRDDLLMGPDSASRRVLGTCSGVGPLYRVTPTKGDPYVVNDAHVLSLKTTSRGYRGKNRDGEKYPKGVVVNVGVKDFAGATNTFRHTHKGWRAGVDFVTGPVLPVDPYLLGVLLGDGCINGTISVTTADQEIASMCETQAAHWGLTCNVIPKEGNAASAIYLTAGRVGGKTNPLMAALRGLGFVSVDQRACPKFIPHAYKTASRVDRLALLAGILDTDGHYDGKGFYLTLKSEQLFDDTLFLIRSLGFSAYKRNIRKTCVNNGVTGDYFSLSISGALDTVPVRLKRRLGAARTQIKDHLVTGLSVESVGQGEYFGFEVDGDHLFLLGDFTVTHNSRVSKLTFARIQRPTLFLTTRGILMHQMRETFMRDMNIPVGIYGDDEWSEDSNLMNVGMVQTFAARLEVKTVKSEIGALVQRRQTAESKDVDKLRAQLIKAKTDPVEIQKRIVALLDGLQRSYEAPEVTLRKINARVFNHDTDRLATIELLKTFEVLILEEAHEASSDGYYGITKLCINAHYRLALTGTPFMKDSEQANMRLEACSGPVAITVSELMLIQRGILAKPYFKFIDDRGLLGLCENAKGELVERKLYQSTPYQAAYDIGISGNISRNKLIVREVVTAKRYGLSSLVLVQHKAHGRRLELMLGAEGVRATFIEGLHSQAQRKSAIEDLKAGRIDCLIGSTILDVGVDVPAVGVVILAGAGKAEVAVRQRIGRGLREKKNGSANVCFVVDFVDSVNNHLRDHGRERRQIIASTPGFAEGVVNEFSYEALGFAKKAA